MIAAVCHIGVVNIATSGAQYIHKLPTKTGETVTSVDFGAISTLALHDDRVAIGNKYKYISGTAPAEEGKVCSLVAV